MPVNLTTATMRKEYRRILRLLFTEQMKKALPQFTTLETKSRFVGTDEFVFKYQSGWGDLCFFIVLSPDTKADRFWFDLGWSSSGGFPDLPYRPFGEASASCSEFAKDKFTLRFRSVATGVPEAWEIVPVSANPEHYVTSQIADISRTKAEQLVADKVDDAVNMLKRFAVPYFEEILMLKKSV